MPRAISPFKLGLFIVICGSVGLVALIWLGASHFFEERKTYVSYFNESVKGLQAGATINYRGVPVGSVDSIGLAPDGILIEVTMDLNPSFNVTENLAIQLRPQGLTGLNYLEIDKAPENLEKRTPHLDFSPEYPLIPSYPSEIQQLKSALQNLYEQVSSLDIKGLLNSWTNTSVLVNQILADIEGAVESNDWRETVAAAKDTAQKSAEFMDRLLKASSEDGMKKGFANLSESLEATRQATETLSRQLKSLPPDALAGMVREWDRTMGAGNKFFSDLDQEIAQAAPPLQQSLQELRILITQLSQVVQTLKEQPNRILFPPKAQSPFERK